jgi:regulation of enolase protein 1 (concanavalin A-like superfamily)
MRTISWKSGNWINHPASSEIVGENFHVRTLPESDFWRNTSYGFIHDSGHALLVDFPDQSAMEVTFLLDFSGQFDQAGIIIHSDSEHWIKSGVETVDGIPQVGAVVTAKNSDWSLAPVPQWAGKEVTIRASRSGNAVTFRGRCDGEDRLIRVAPINPDLPWKAGLHCANPMSNVLEVVFTKWVTTDSDLNLH